MPPPDLKPIVIALAFALFGLVVVAVNLVLQ
jgi:hypothetical protein